MKQLSVILVDDHEIFLTGLKVLLDNFKGLIRVDGIAKSFSGLRKLLDAGVKPDFILLDYLLSDSDGIKICEWIRKYPEWKDIKVIMLSAYTSHYLSSKNFEIIIQSIDEGANGYLLKDSSVNEIFTAMNEILSGEIFVLGNTLDLKEINKQIISDRRRLKRFLKYQSNFSLTRREIEIIKMMATGQSAKEISNLLGVSEEAITNHKDNIRSRLKDKYDINFRNSTELIVWAIKNRIIEI